MTVSSRSLEKSHPLLIAFLVAIGCLAALSTDIYLPAMPDAARDLKVSMAPVQWSLGAFLLSYAFGQLIFGALSDHFGRRAPLLGGMALYTLGNAVCAFAPTVEILILGRFISGFGACAGVVSAYAIARDSHSGAALTRIVARVGAIIALAPVLAPSLGALLNGWLGWRGIFDSLLLVGLVLLGWAALTFRDTLAPGDRSIGRVGTALRAYGRMARQRKLAPLLIANAASFTALFAFIASSPDLLIGRLSVSPEGFSLMFAANAAVMLAANMLLAKISGRFSPESLLLLSALVILAGGVLMLAGTAIPAAAWLIAPMMLATAGVAVTMASSMSALLDASGHQAAKASALAGSTRFIAAAAVTFLLAEIGTDSTLPLAITVIICGATCLTAGRALRKSTATDASYAGEAQL